MTGVGEQIENWRKMTTAAERLTTADRRWTEDETAETAETAETSTETARIPVLWLDSGDKTTELRTRTGEEPRTRTS